MRHWIPAVVALSLIAALPGCKRKPAEPASAPAVAAESSAPTVASSEPTADEEALAKKKHAVEIATRDQTFTDDLKGQWAVRATASSSYYADDSKEAFTAKMATGAPDMPEANDGEQKCWEAKSESKSIEWLELGYAKPVKATGVRVRQNRGPGSVVKVEILDENGVRHAVWNGVDDTRYDAHEIGWFERLFEKTTYNATGVRITMALSAVDDTVCVDAVQLLGE